MPLQNYQKAEIVKLMPDTRILDWPKSIGWGNEQIENIWRAYAKAASDAGENDFIARIDSDVFFFNATIFKMAEICDADLIGDGHFVDFGYVQGGCYFFRARAVNEINALIQRESMAKLTEEIDIVVEDIAATHFARRLGMKVWLTWFMMFPDELGKAGRLTAWAKWKFSCAHFVMKNKAAMLETYAREILHHNEPDSYKKAMALE